MELKPFKHFIAMSKEKIDEAMAPIRARQVRSQAELKMAELDADILNKETAVQELFTQKGANIDFPNLMNKLDDIALLERRKKQYETVLGQLFPAEAAHD